MGTHPIFESDFDCLTDMRQFYSDEEIAEIMAPIEDPLQMQKIIEVKRGPISRFLTTVIRGFGVVSYVKIYEIHSSSCFFVDSSDSSHPWSYCRRLLCLQKGHEKAKTTQCGSYLRLRRRVKSYFIYFYISKTAIYQPNKNIFDKSSLEFIFEMHFAFMQAFVGKNVYSSG